MRWSPKGVLLALAVSGCGITIRSHPGWSDATVLIRVRRDGSVRWREIDRFEGRRVERTTSVPPALAARWRERLRTTPLGTAPLRMASYRFSERWCTAFYTDQGRFVIRGAGRRMRVERGCVANDALTRLQALEREIDTTIGERLKTP